MLSVHIKISSLYMISGFRLRLGRDLEFVLHSNSKSSGLSFVQLLLEQAALRLNQLSRAGINGVKNSTGMLDFPLPGFESEPVHRGSIKM